MKKNLTAYILLYNFIGFAAAVGGWLWEVLLFLAKDRQFVNRGFLYGPYLPVYGVGAVILSMLFYYKDIGTIITYAYLKIADNPKDLSRRLLHFQQKAKRKWLAGNARIFLACMFGGSLVELLSGLLLWHIFNKKYWDYTGYFMNLYGYVCLFSALGFGIFGLLWVRLIAPRLIWVWERLRFPIQILMIGLLDMLLITDAVFSLMQPNSGENITFSFLLLRNCMEIT